MTYMIKEKMFLIFDTEKVFRLCCPNETITTEMKREGETTMEVKRFQTPMMPKLSVDEEGQEVVEWISRADFNKIKFPPNVDAEEKEEGDVPMS